jgi:hypothetical protein
MAGTRALFASIGASVALVAAAALSLLAVSAVFAFGGWSDSTPESIKRPALIFAGSTLPAPGSEATGVARSADIVAPAPRPERRRDASPSGSAAGSDDARSANRPATSGLAIKAPPTANLDPPVVRPPAAQPPPPAAPAKRNGDHVRNAGDALSGKVQDTGNSLAAATEPLAPPVSVAVQQVFNLVAEVVRRTTEGLGSTLDALLPKK